MRFGIPTLLLTVIFVAICITVVARVTRDIRERWHFESDLRSMGAYYVAFNEGDNRPDWVSFAGPLKSPRIAKYRSFKQIDFAGARLTDESVRNIAALDSIEMLHLTNCDITDDQIGLLSQIGHIEILRLNGSPVTDGAIPAICSIPGLKAVDLSGTFVTDNGLAILRDRCPGLSVNH
ncbi:hypothetical protein SH501x_001163 [Pirellulaceae bacterium SH501]